MQLLHILTSLISGHCHQLCSIPVEINYYRNNNEQRAHVQTASSNLIRSAYKQ